MAGRLVKSGGIHTSDTAAGFMAFQFHSALVHDKLTVIVLVNRGRESAGTRGECGGPLHCRAHVQFHHRATDTEPELTERLKRCLFEMAEKKIRSFSHRSSARISASRAQACRAAERCEGAKILQLHH
jgi:hypothetical protein